MLRNDLNTSNNRNNNSKSFFRHPTTQDQLIGASFNERRQKQLQLNYQQQKVANRQRLEQVYRNKPSNFPQRDNTVIPPIHQFQQHNLNRQEKGRHNIYQQDKSQPSQQIQQHNLHHQESEDGRLIYHHQQEQDRQVQQLTNDGSEYYSYLEHRGQPPVENKLDCFPNSYLDLESGLPVLDFQTTNFNNDQSACNLEEDSNAKIPTALNPATDIHPSPPVLNLKTPADPNQTPILQVDIHPAQTDATMNCVSTGPKKIISEPRTNQAQAPPPPPLPPHNNSPQKRQQQQQQPNNNPPTSSSKSALQKRSSTTARRPSGGKDLKMMKDPVRENEKDATDSDSDIAEVTDHSESDEEFDSLTIPLKLGQAMDILKRRESVEENKLVEDLKSLSRTPDNDNHYCLNENRVALLVHVGHYVDSKCGRSVFKKGFKNLFKNTLPDMEKQWKSLYAKPLSLIPTGLQWLMKQLFVCLCSQALDQTKTNRTVLSNEIDKTIDKLKKNIEPDKLLTVITDFVKNISKKLFSKRGDVIPEDDSSSVKKKQCAEQKTTAFCFSPNPQTNNKGPTSGKYDSDSCSVSSYAGSEKSSNRKRPYNMEIMAKTHQDGQKKNTFGYPKPRVTFIASNQDRRRQRTQEDTTPYYREDRRCTPDRDHYRNCYKAPSFKQECIPFDKMFGHGEKYTGYLGFDSSCVLVNPSVFHRLRKDACELRVMKPNKTIASAMREIVFGIIQTGLANPNVKITFRDLAVQFITVITRTIMGKPCYSPNDMIKYIKNKDSSSDENIEAVQVCVNMLWMHDMNNLDIVSVPWTLILKWTEEFSSLIRDHVQEGVVKNLYRFNDKTKEFNEFFIKVENIMKDKFSHLLPLFSELSKLNDLCTYTLFGINFYVPDNNDGTYFTGTLIQNLYPIWSIYRDSTLDLSNVKGEDDGMGKALCCLPLVYVTRLRGYGKVKEETVIKQNFASKDIMDSIISSIPGDAHRM